MTVHRIQHLPLGIRDLAFDLTREQIEKRTVIVQRDGDFRNNVDLTMTLNDGLVLATLVGRARRACSPTDTTEASYKRLMALAQALVEGRRA